jgi:hypothetical protein
MKPALFLFFTAMTLFTNSNAQTSFDYDVLIEPISVQGAVGLQSYAFGQSNGKWLIIGGRRDGLHARQPFNAFPATNNNTSIYVIDPLAQQLWSASLNSLPTDIAEQLQSTNMNFDQDGDTLYIIGGYAFSQTADDHITFDKLTTLNVSQVINAIINGQSIDAMFKQTTDPVFAVTGAQLGKIDDTFYLIGGHRFDGRYNPMNNPTFTQTYQTKIQKFKINNSGTAPTISDYTEVIDPVHLRRRDYNLMSQIFPDGTFGYMISSGVFQLSTDLPFLYPVEIKATGYEAKTDFNQYLSNYHGAKVPLYDAIQNVTHNLFFGGISQYYYENGQLIQDDEVPFVKTISRFTRYADGTYEEFNLPIEMPGLKGAGSEFIPNTSIPLLYNEIVDLNALTLDTTILGHIYGGINSTQLNPFSNNQTSSTSADPSIYSVKLIRKSTSGIDNQPINGQNPFSMRVSPNPAKNQFTVEIDMSQAQEARYFLNSLEGKILQMGLLDKLNSSNHKQTLKLDKSIAPQVLQLIVVIDGKFFLSEKLIKE